jgi:hypothetical protein
LFAGFVLGQTGEIEIAFALPAAAGTDKGII